MWFRKTFIASSLLLTVLLTLAPVSGARAEGPKDVLQLVPDDAWGFVVLKSLNNLDEKAAQELRSLFKALWRAQRVTTLFVTHNVAEAAQLATRVLVFTGSPARIAADIDMRREGESRDNAELLLRSALDAAQAGPASI